jgi:hypothetical protein
VAREQLINPQFVPALMAVVEQELRSDAQGVLVASASA